MTKTVGLKELRGNVAKYARKVRAGDSYVVFKHSKPLFKLTPLDDDQRWEEVVDFTKIHRGGVDIDEVLTRL